jgi:PPM family protein phosphatase
MANTPAARAASLGRRQPPGEGGPAGYGGAEQGEGEYGDDGYAEGDYEGDADYAPEEGSRRSRRKQQRAGRKRGCLVPSLVALVALGLVGGGGYAGYQWTRTQYFIGAHGDHVAVYQGVNQNLAGLSLSKVYQDYPGIQLKYLPSYQQTSVHSTISANNLAAANQTVAQLKNQATLCQQIATTPSTPASPTPAPTPTPTQSHPAKTGTPDTTKGPGKPSATPSAPAPSSMLSPQQQQLAQQCPTS